METLTQKQLKSTKKCVTCKEVKQLSKFSKNKHVTSGHQSYCRKCGIALTVAYQRTKKGLISRTYAKQRQRSKQRNHAMPTYSKELLTEWLYAQPKFHLLFDVWKESNYKTELIPSIDRLDDDIGYQINNIQLLAWSAHHAKGTADMRSGKLKCGKITQKSVMQFTNKGEFIAEYVSIREAMRCTGINNGSISKCCSFKHASAGGLIWRLKENRYRT